MANEDHLTILNQGVESWNQWRKDNPDVVPDLISTDLSHADLSHADLSHTDLSHTDLSHTTLNYANLNFANLSNANLNFAQLLVAKLYNTDFSNANLYDATLINADLRNADLSDANLIASTLRNADLSDANLVAADLRNADLYNANLCQANLRQANFRDADLSNTNLSGTDLSNANLSTVQALKTDFTEATLTGACIENWNINSGAKLDEVICNYIYLQNECQDRRPHTGNFAPGEFAQLFQTDISTVDLIFHTHINWQAFAYSFRKLETENKGAQPTIRSIENKGDGIVTVKVYVAPNTTKERLYDEFMQAYELAKAELETPSQRQLENKDKSINQLIFMTDKLNINQPFNPAIGIANKNNPGELQTTPPHANTPEKPSLTKVLGKIQRQLQMLQLDNPNATEVEKQQFISAATPPVQRQCAVNALEDGGQAILEGFINHSHITIVTAMIEGWRDDEE